MSGEGRLFVDFYVYLAFLAVKQAISKKQDLSRPIASGKQGTKMNSEQLELPGKWFNGGGGVKTSQVLHLTSLTPHRSCLLYYHVYFIIYILYNHINIIPPTPIFHINSNIPFPSFTCSCFSLMLIQKSWYYQLPASGLRSPYACPPSCGSAHGQIPVCHQTALSTGRRHAASPTLSVGTGPA